VPAVVEDFTLARLQLARLQLARLQLARLQLARLELAGVDHHCDARPTVFTAITRYSPTSPGSSGWTT